MLPFRVRCSRRCSRSWRHSNHGSEGERQAESQPRRQRARPRQGVERRGFGVPRRRWFVAGDLRCSRHRPTQARSWQDARGSDHSQGHEAGGAVADPVVDVPPRCHGARAGGLVARRGCSTPRAGLDAGHLQPARRADHQHDRPAAGAIAEAGAHRPLAVRPAEVRARVSGRSRTCG